jgi:L-lactate dehydrogenase complex protein LldG
MSDARSRILARLRDTAAPVPVSALSSGPGPTRSREEKIAQFTQMLEAVRGRVLHASKADWQQHLNQLLGEREIKRLLIGPGSWPGNAIVAQPPQGVELIGYDKPVEAWKESLFHDIDAAVTGALGAVAGTGSLALWPSAAEPRLMSLVPPLHIVVLDAGLLYDSFDEIIQTQRWAKKMPTNALLISGPSKSADIEQVLAYGVHGPKELVVLLCR